jgi:hypothetical protein
MLPFAGVRAMARTRNWLDWGVERLILRVLSSDMRLYATFLGVGWGGPFPYLPIERALRAKNKVPESRRFYLKPRNNSSTSYCSRRSQDARNMSS